MGRENQQIIRGESLQRAADLLCHIRRIGAATISIYNLSAIESRNWKSALLVGTNYATDKLDGILAREGAKRSGKPLSNQGKNLDQVTDKQAHYMIATTHIIEAARRGESIFATIMFGALAIQKWRDDTVNDKRAEAAMVSEHTGQPIQIGAIASSKRKMLFSSIADTLTESPIADTRAGRVVLGTAHIATTAMSLKSGYEIINMLNDSIEAASEIEVANKNLVYLAESKTDEPANNNILA
ncbi:MAG: CDP-alcohol phosphatidyltransferase family protein [Candidatus Saccharimonadales bacterium]